MTDEKTPEPAEERLTEKDSGANEPSTEGPSEPEVIQVDPAPEYDRSLSALRKKRAASQQLTAVDNDDVESVVKTPADIQSKRLQIPSSPHVKAVDEIEAPSELSDSQEITHETDRLDRLKQFAARHTDSLIAIGLLLAGFLAVVTTYGSLGWSWDEAYYLPPARLALEWFAGGAPTSPEALDLYWREINELPSFCKILWAASLMTLEPWIGPIAAMRLPSAVLFGALLALLYLFLKDDLGRGGALIGAVAFACFPRVFGHAHIAATETTITFIMLATTYAFRRGLDSKGWAIATGLLFGVAIATKINAFFLFPALLLWAVIYRPKDLAYPVAAMVFLAPIVFLLLWPWLWHETILRALDYLKFHAGHQDTAIFYEGAKWGYGESNAPMHYPFVMIAITTPLILLLGLFLGGLRALTTIRRPFVGLVLIQAALPILIIAAPGQPKYDGVRLFLPAFPFLAALIALGFDGVVKSMEKRPDGHGVLKRPVLVAVLIGAMIVVSGNEMRKSHPYQLTYFNRIVGGLPGAFDKGFEVAYWGDRLSQDVLDWMNDPRNVPGGSAIKTRAFFARSLEQHQQWGNLRDDIHIDELPDGKKTFDFHLIQTRRGFWGEIDWMLYANAPRAKAVFDHQGVPLFIMYGGLNEYVTR